MAKLEKWLIFLNRVWCVGKMLNLLLDQFTIIRLIKSWFKLTEGPSKPRGGGQILADQFTLFQPGGGQIMPTTILLPPGIFRPSYGPEC